MQPILLEDFNFWDVIWWMLMAWVVVMVIWVFIALFGDIFRRRDLSGFSKAFWVFLIFFFPLLGALLYVIFRPSVLPEEQRYVEQQHRAAAYDEIARAQQLVQSGAITQAEFDEIKRKTLA